MSAQSINLGLFEIRVFPFWLLVGVGFSIALTLWIAQRNGERPSRWLDVIVSAVILGVVGARVGHILLNWAYFSTHTSEITNLAAGGLSWHGALIGGLIGGIIFAPIRRIKVLRWFDVASLCVPILVASIWLASANSYSTYGVEVRTLADFPSWLVIESPDIFGSIAPRLNLLPVGLLLAAVAMLISIGLTISRRFVGIRLWIVLMITGFGMAVIDAFRADYVPSLLDRRADQVLDCAVVLLSLGILVATLLVPRMIAFALPKKSAPQ